MISLIYRTGLYRASGFNSDPAQIGFVAPLIILYALYKKKYWMILISFIAILASASTTSLVSSLIVLLFWLINKSSIKKSITTKQLLIILSTILGIVIVCILFGKQVAQVFNSIVSKFFNRINSVYLDSTTINIRLKYLIYAPKALYNLDIKSIFGLGYGTASYGYVIDESVLNAIGKSNNFAYDPENTYISYILDTGIVGFSIFLLYITRIYRFYYAKIKNKYSDIDLMLFASVLATIISFFFYHYILFTPQVLISIVALSNIDVVYFVNSDSRRIDIVNQENNNGQ